MRQNILITGASSGIGMEMARQFAAMGRNLALCARRVDNLATLRAEIVATHPGIRVAVRALDVTQYDDVFTVFTAFEQDLGKIDRVIVNAGVGKTQPLGVGRFAENKRCVETNFVGALAQCEAAMQIFRRQNSGHLVLVSSVSEARGLPRHNNVYAATKVALSHLGEGLRCELLDSPICVSTLLPGYIASEMTAARGGSFMVDTVTGSRALVRAIEREVGSAYLPRWPWFFLARFLRHAPLRLISRFG